MSIKTAFYGRLTEMTDHWMDLFGYFAPSVVSDTFEEYRAVRERAGLMDFSMLRKADLSGPGALGLVDSVVTRDLTKVSPGRIAYSALVDGDGKMVDDCTACVYGPDRVRFCGGNDRDAEILAEAAVSTNVEVRTFTDEMPHLCVQGPLSRRLLQPITDMDLSNEAFPYYSFRDGVRVGGIPLFMTRLGYTAELGYELWVERERAVELFDALIEAGEPHGMAVIGMDALDLLRVEGGFVIGGVEYDPAVSPYECGLGWAVDLFKAELRGRKGLERDREATELRLGSVVLEAGGAGATGAALSVDGEQAGFVTQAVSSPFLGGRTLGLAKLRRGRNAVGTRLLAGLGSGTVEGEVVAHPVYDPKRTRAKGLG
ncbi:MAG: aminomethyltransferase family protein [Acidimicrobiales bacterium]